MTVPLRQHFFHPFYCPVDLFSCDAEGRCESHGLLVGVFAEHAHFHQFLAVGHCLARGLLELDAYPQASTSDFFDLVGLDRSESLEEISSHVAGVVLVFSSIQDFDDLAGDGCGQRVAAEGAAVVAGGEYAQDFSRGDDRGDWHDASAEGFAEDEDVGMDAFVLAGECKSGSPETCLDLVGDEQDVVLGADFADLFEVTVWRDDDPRFALDGFDQEANGVFIDGRLECVDVAVFYDFESWGEGSESISTLGVGAEANDGRCSSVEVLGADDDLCFALCDAFLSVSPLAGRLNCGLDAFCAGVHGEDRFHLAQLCEGGAHGSQLVVMECS